MPAEHCHKQAVWHNADTGPCADPAVPDLAEFGWQRGYSGQGKMVEQGRGRAFQWAGQHGEEGGD